MGRVPKAALGQLQRAGKEQVLVEGTKLGRESH